MQWLSFLQPFWHSSWRQISLFPHSWSSLHFSSHREVDLCNNDNLIIAFIIGQGRHGWQGPQGLDLAWILQKQKRRQQQHAADVASTVSALPAKNWRWRPCWVFLWLKLYKKSWGIRKKKSAFAKKVSRQNIIRIIQFHLEMVFCYQNCSELLWEKIVLVIKKFLRSLKQFFQAVKGQNNFW